MTEILSHKFMLALEESRDRLYTHALATATTPAKAEAALQKAIRAEFVSFAADPSFDVAAALDKQFAAPVAAPDTESSSAAMPADVWARLSAAVQIEASRSNSATALNPDSVLLSPDPLLAPRKASILDDGEAFDLSPPSRFVLASVIAVVIGIVLTIYILTRPSSTTLHPASGAPASASASAPSSAPSEK